MIGDLWLAVGDKAGSWDDLAAPEQFLGVNLVIAKISDWESILKEELGAQTIEQRMTQPLPNLPKEIASNTHKVMDALNYFKAQSVRGRWTLDAIVKGTTPLARIKNDLSVNLGWLATHPSLITLSTYGKTEWVRNNLNYVENYAHALGQTYGLLIALILPFFKDGDSLLVAPAPDDDPQNPNEPLNADIKSLSSSLLDYTQRSLRVWQNTKMAKLDCAAFTDLQQKYFQDTLLNMDALHSIAEMGAALLALSQNTKGDIRLHDPNRTWREIKFYKFEELFS